MKRPMYIFIASAMIFFSCNREEKDLASTLSENSLEAYRQFLIKYPNSGSIPVIRDSIKAKEKKLWPRLPVFPDKPELKVIFYAMSPNPEMYLKLHTLHPDWKWNIYDQVKHWTPKDNSILMFHDELEADFNDVDDKIFHFKGRALHGRKLEEKDKKILYRINWHQFTLSPPNGKQIELTACYDNEKLIGYRYDSIGLTRLKSGDEMVIYDKYGWRIVTVEKPLQSDKLDIKDLIFNEKRADGTTYYRIIKSLVLFGSADGMTALAWDDQ